MSRVRYRSIAVSLALCAMVLRALLPDGWMPAANAAQSGSLFVICSVDGNHHRGGKTPEDPQQHAHTPCAFAAAAPLSPPASAGVAFRAFNGISVIARSFHATPLIAAPDYQPNAARAPPVSA